MVVAATGLVVTGLVVAVVEGMDSVEAEAMVVEGMDSVEAEAVVTVVGGAAAAIARKTQ